jgi:hypothetical protein
VIYGSIPPEIREEFTEPVVESPIRMMNE